MRTQTIGEGLAAVDAAIGFSIRPQPFMAFDFGVRYVAHFQGNFFDETHHSITPYFGFTGWNR